MRPTALVLLALALVAPSAQACSLAYRPYEKASFHDDGLWFVDGESLRRVDGLVESPVVEGFFLSYARLPGGGLLVAGQDGLGADCSGDPWLELRDGDTVLWRQDEGARVFAHPLGPFVQMDRDLLRLDGDDLAPYGTRPDDAYIVGWTTDGLPVSRDGLGVRFGDAFLPLPTGDEPEVAQQDGLLGVIEVAWDNGAEAGTTAILHVVDGDEVSNVTWGIPAGWGDGLAWAKGWLAAAGGRAYLVTDKVTDLGVQDARSVSSRGKQGVVFTDQGYVVFDGTEPVEAWERDPRTGLWRPVPHGTQDAQDIDAAFTGPGPWLAQAERDPGSLTGDGDEGTFTIPGAGPMAVALAALAFAAARRR